MPVSIAVRRNLALAMLTIALIGSSLSQAQAAEACPPATPARSSTPVLAAGLIWR